ncbi:MAG: carboxypeptidase regulatory-like domain-containing protein [Planctomycetes bacterium]|nr:carboxypeptidase regulatory-like domain-containing protein [Planctomycetota bacterium]
MKAGGALLLGVVALALAGAAALVLLREDEEAARPVQEEDAVETGHAGGSEVEVNGLEGVPGLVRESAPQADPAAARFFHVSGRVVNEQGEPLAGAVAMAFRPGFRGIGGTIVARTQADEQGRYTLRVPRGTELRIEASAEGYAFARIDVKEYGGDGHDFRLAPERRPR